MPRSSRPVMLTGGGTLGSVTPILGMYEAWKKRDPEQEFVWVGTLRGPERALVEEAGIPFIPLLVPKAYRYFTWRWFFFPLLLVWSLVVSGVLLFRYRPSWILSAGAYVSVPLAWLAPLFKTRVAIHQLDYLPGLANVLMAPVSSLVTATWPITKEHFPKKTVHVVGALAYGSHLKATSREEAYEHFDIDRHKSTVLVLGGGGGSVALNRAFEEVADSLTQDVNVLHATGIGKNIFENRKAPENYHVTELFVEDFGQALNVADVVVTRAGLGTLLELVRQKKASIFIPLPNSPQEANAKAVEEAGAGAVLDQRDLDDKLTTTIRDVLEPTKKQKLEERIGELFPVDGAEEIMELIQQKTSQD